jgi:5-methylthioadenosine/S-adenosylhomocysteine deaminase
LEGKRFNWTGTSGSSLNFPHPVNPVLLQNIEFLITQNPEREILEKVDLRIKDDKISGIGNLEPEDSEEVIDCTGKVVMPGLVNTHTHASMSLLRGISDNKELEQWLQEDIFPAEDVMDMEDVNLGAMLACMEMLETGTTCFNDMYEGVDEVAEAVEESGIRAVLSRGIFDWDEKGAERIEEAKEAVEKYSSHDLIYPGIAPHAVYSCSKELLKEMKDYAEKKQVPYHIHVSETEKENRDLEAEHGVTPTQYLNEQGLFDSSVVAAHAAWLTDEDKEIFEEKSASIAHNPSANSKLGSGIADIPEMMDRGVNVALGTDGPASNNNFNLFEEMKTASLVHKLESPENIDEQQVLDMATINGAKALGLGDEIGSLEEGKKADLLVIDLEDSELTPFYGKQGLVSNLVFSFTGNPEKVFVDGEKVVEDGRVLGVERKNLMEKAQEKVPKFQEATEDQD